MKDVEKWYSKVCGKFARGKITARLFRKFQTQYDNMTKKSR